MSGYMLAWATFGRQETSRMIVFSGIFGMAQIVFAYFLIKSFFALDMAITVTLMIDVVAVIFRKISNIKPLTKDASPNGAAQTVKDGPKQDVSAHA